MATLNIDIVKSKIAEIADHIQRIRNMEFTLEELNSDDDIQDLISHRLHTAVEAAIDVTAHIVSSLNLFQKEEAGDLFLELANKKIITKELAGSMGKACGLRNLIVHEYGSLDFTKLFYDYKEDLKDLEEFNRQIYGYLERLTKEKRGSEQNR
jgi:uncharacterized protein YutE (UPF0331/DUF86 family)